MPKGGRAKLGPRPMRHSSMRHGVFLLLALLVCGCSAVPVPPSEQASAAATPVLRSEPSASAATRPPSSLATVETPGPIPPSAPAEPSVTPSTAPSPSRQPAIDCHISVQSCLQAIDLVRAASPDAAAGASLIAVIDVCDRLDGTGTATTCDRRWAFDSYVVLVSRPVVLVSRPVGSEAWQVFTVVGELGPERATLYDGTLPRRLVTAIEDLLATPAIVRFSNDVLSFDHRGT
jgi:hypothetical protein